MFRQTFLAATPAVAGAARAAGCQAVAEDSLAPFFAAALAADLAAALAADLFVDAFDGVRS
ncbi:hypothetical protein H9Y04_40330 [Streptomyces sp. TRM66268-LWL]|uniref:Uncharacterized protein n=1 Tax=Streptomyces polyasparticus TaxID=2767826 RepID=A0ABR7SWY8_9ACTN|nr:hypothetical protein [Streptomyces polyasparticus]MBC9718793.1 hypothetical protein [Streptomyces polyasparticus]